VRRASAGFYNVSNGYAGDGSPLPPDSAAGSYAPWFLPVQWALDTAIRSVLAPDATAAQPAQAGLYVRQFPSPGYSMNFLASSISIITPIYMTLIFTMTVRVLLTRILEEKEKKIKVSGGHHHLASAHAMLLLPSACLAAGVSHRPPLLLLLLRSATSSAAAAGGGVACR